MDNKIQNLKTLDDDQNQSIINPLPFDARELEKNNLISDFDIDKVTQ